MCYFMRLGSWCLAPLSTIFSYFVAVSFINAGTRSTRRKPPTCRKSLRKLSNIKWNRVHFAISGIRTHNFRYMISTDCTGSSNSNYDAITHRTDPMCYFIYITSMLSDSKCTSFLLNDMVLVVRRTQASSWYSQS